MPPKLHPQAEDTARERLEQGARGPSWTSPGNTGAGQRSWGTRHDNSVGTTATSYFPQKRKLRPGRKQDSQETRQCAYQAGAPTAPGNKVCRQQGLS